MMIRGLLLLYTGLIGSFGCVYSQNDAVANAQHTILGQNSAQVGVSVPITNEHPNAQWFPDAGLGLFIHFGIASVHGGIDLSWSMYANKSWEDGEVTPTEYWKFADQWNPINFDAEEIVTKAKEAGFKSDLF